MVEGQQCKGVTNEELVAQAKTGDRTALAALWEQNRGLLAVLFRRLYIRAGARTAQAGVIWGGRRAMLLPCHCAGCAGV